MQGKLPHLPQIESQCKSKHNENKTRCLIQGSNRYVPESAPEAGSLFITKGDEQVLEKR